MVHRCPGKLTFDATMLECTNADGIPACSKGGVFANPINCEQYYTCIQAADGWVQEVLMCDAGKMYNEVQKMCSDPCGWPSPKFSCTAEGRFPDPQSCRNYFVCVADPAHSGFFVMTPRRCPLDFEWDPSSNGGYGHCVSPELYPCKPLTENKCNIPDSYYCGTNAPHANRNSVNIPDDKSKRYSFRLSGPPIADKLKKIHHLKLNAH